MKLKDFYNVTSVKQGDVFAVIITCYIDPFGNMKFYRCPYPPQLADGIPQGSYYGSQKDNIHLQDLFPTIRDYLELDQ